MNFQNHAPFRAAAPTLVKNQYSILHQEAEYLQERINVCKVQSRKLARELKKDSLKTSETQDNVDSKIPKGPHVKPARKWRARLAQCVNDRSALEGRLADVSMEIERMELRQWGDHTLQNPNTMPSCFRQGTNVPSGQSWPTQPLDSTWNLMYEPPVAMGWTQYYVENAYNSLKSQTLPAESMRPLEFLEEPHAGSDEPAFQPAAETQTLLNSSIMRNHQGAALRLQRLAGNKKGRHWK